MNHNKMMALICTFAKEIFWDSSDDEENDGKSAKVENYSEDIVPAMTNRQFKLHFRLSPETFEDMLRKLSTVHGKNITPGHPEIPLDKAAMIMVWYLANLESFRSVANRFGISKSTCSSVLYRMCMLLLKINTKFNIISWPSQNRAQFIASSFEKPHKLPGVIGAIDGSHIRINAPKENHNCYINRKSYHSVLLQGVCDHNKLFIDVFCGLPGSVHDSTLFKRSDLYKRIESNNITFPNNTHLIGDLAYTLSPYLLVGFKDYGNLTRRQRNFNLILNKSRSVIENTFALLKGRFRRLKFLETVRLDFISLIIVAACILHNICILSGEIVDDLIDINQEIQEERTNASLDQPFNNEHENNIAIRKRTDIMNALPIIIRNGDVV